MFSTWHKLYSHTLIVLAIGCPIFPKIFQNFGSQLTRQTLYQGQMSSLQGSNIGTKILVPRYYASNFPTNLKCPRYRVPTLISSPVLLFNDDKVLSSLYILSIARTKYPRHRCPRQLQLPFLVVTVFLQIYISNIFKTTLYDYKICRNNKTITSKMES